MILDCFAIILCIINEFINNYKTIIKLKQVCRLFYNYKFDVEYDGDGRNLSKIKGVNVVSIILESLYNYNDQLYMYNKLTKLIEDNMYFNGRCLRHLTNLTSFTTGSFTISDYGIETLTKLTYLNCLIVNNITDNGLKNLTNLTYLDMENNENITDSSIKYLTKLTYLNCESLNNITDIGISYLTSLTHLVCNKVITDDGLVNLRNLTHLDCSFCCNITDKSLNRLNLIELNCSDNQEITDDSIKNMTNLKYLTCYNTKITDECVKHLSNLIYLKK